MNPPKLIVTMLFLFLFIGFAAIYTTLVPDFIPANLNHNLYNNRVGGTDGERRTVY